MWQELPKAEMSSCEGLTLAIFGDQVHVEFAV